MAAYRFEEFPKWINGVVVESAAEERAHLATKADQCDPATPLVADGFPHRAENPQAVVVPHPSNLPSSAAVRMKRSRERRRNNTRVISFDISASQINALAVAGFLDPTKRDKAVEVARGVGRLMDRLARQGATAAT